MSGNISNNPFASPCVFHIAGLGITRTVVTTWGLMAVLAVVSWASARRFKEQAGPWQAALEGAVSALERAVEDVLPEHAREVFPFIATLWVFIGCANLLAIVPGLHAPTSDLSLTSALAVLVYLSVHWYGVRTQGFKRYAAHFLSPNPLLLPFNLIGELSRTVALAVRLFGNMFSLETAALLVLLVAGFLAPIAILSLHIVEALVQAYIFGTLALIYIAGGIEAREKNASKEKLL